ncbi:hypothetical protein [Microbacterium sp. 69-10]|uniref:hypothetical protein n=1 Tax=Microbacterium sp. 69-10 TaxID=1895783 RepID=UPI000ADCC08F|nr:hypothetical protein [Microbacterium sp. 69-10]
MGLRTWYRSTGADLPFQSPLPAHPGVAMEGYFWRITEPATGRVIIALNGVNRGPHGLWATLGFAARPAAFLRVDAHPRASADRDGIGAHAGDAFHGDDRWLRVDLGPDARLDVTIGDPLPWPHRAFGGSRVFQSVPALNQYWHPWLLGGRANGTATVDDETWELQDAQIYAEVTGLVVRLPGGRVIRLGIRGSARCMRSSTMNDGCSIAGVSSGRSTSRARHRAQHPISCPCRCPPRDATRRVHSSTWPARSR